MKPTLLASVAMEETETTYARKIFSMEILETEKRKMNKNKEKKKELTHFLEHYWIYAIILVIILFYFTSSNLSYTDNQ